MQKRNRTFVFEELHKNFIHKRQDIKQDCTTSDQELVCLPRTFFDPSWCCSKQTSLECLLTSPQLGWHRACSALAHTEIWWLSAFQLAENQEWFFLLVSRCMAWRVVIHTRLNVSAKGTYGNRGVAAQFSTCETWARLLDLVRTLQPEKSGGTEKQGELKH